MRSSSTRPGRLRRTLALSGAASVLALAGQTLPAAAQTTGPPPLDPGRQANGNPLPVFSYPPKQACMQANPGNATIEEKPWSQLALGFEQAHAQGLTGRGQTVAVIDTGVNDAHPRLAAVTDGSSSVPDGNALKDCDGHGTIVAGIVAAQGTSDTGYIGVAPESSILSIRQQSSLFRDDQSNQTIGNTETMAQAVNRAVAMGAQVINISQSSCQTVAQASSYNDSGNQQLHNAVKKAYEANRVVVAAAGNVGEQCQKNPSGNPTTAVLPAWFDQYVLTVASVGQQGAPSEFTVPGPWVDVAAPGENLIALDPGVGGRGLASQIATGQGEPGPIQGTSFAAPYVSGLVALIKQKYGDQLSAADIMERIKSTAVHPGGSNGRNDIVGYGMIDFMAALNDVVPAEHGKAPAPAGPARLQADVIPQKDWPAILIALGLAGSGIAALIFTAFLVNAVRNLRARRAAIDEKQRR